MTNKIFANPFYCLEKIDSIFVAKHIPLVSEEDWIKAGVKIIEEIGAEKYLKLVLDNLKGNFE
jgi:hypothetical protein